MTSSVESSNISITGNTSPASEAAAYDPRVCLASVGYVVQESTEHPGFWTWAALTRPSGTLHPTADIALTGAWEHAVLRTLDKMHLELSGKAARKYFADFEPEDQGRIVQNHLGIDCSGVAYIGGDKVFHILEKRLGTVLNNYGDPKRGHYGDVRLDLTGNTSINCIEPYDAVKHAKYDHTFTPIKREWKENYGITQDIPLRAETTID